jgi:hypothetical protein
MHKIYNLFFTASLTLALGIVIPLNSFAGDAPAVSSQNEADSAKDYIIRLKNGTVLPCKILEKSFKGARILSENLGELFIPLAEIESIKEKKAPEEKKTGEENPAQSSAEELKKLAAEKEKLTAEKENLAKKEAEITEKKQLETEINLSKKHVESLEKGTKIYWFPNPNDTRYFFAPTARPLGRGNGYLQDVAILIGGANYGVSDNISLGFMASLIPFIDVTQQLLAFTPKIGFNITDNISLGGGGVYLSGAGLAQMGVIYGVSTFGTSDTNLSLALGGAYGNISRGGAFKPVKAQEVVQGTAAIGMVGGMHRIFETVSIVTENWMIYDSVSQKNTYMISWGFRFFGEVSSWDFGIVYPIIPTVDTFPVPYVDFVWKFQ